MLVLLCACAYLAAGAAEPAPALQGASRWSVASSVLLSDAATTGGELGYRLQAALTLRAQPLAQGLLLHFTLESPQLMLRGKHQNAEFLPKPSIWDSMPSSEFLAVWSEGHITEAFLDPSDPPDVLDYKKALISLFQFQVEEGERNETDVSGYCHVHYDAVSELVFRKSKMQCTWQETVDEDENDGCAERRRVVRYQLSSAGLLDTITADEVLLLRGTDRAHALKARALHMLGRAGAPAPAPASPADLAAARGRLPALQPTPLPLELRPESDDEPKESLSSALSAHRAAVEEARAGSAEAAAATLALLPAIRAATAKELTALLDHPDTDELEGLVRVLGLSGSRGAHLAARETLQLQAKEPPREHLGREYLAALAIAPQVEEFVVRDAMKLGATGGALAPAAALAAAAAARQAPHPARGALATEVKNSLTRTLSKCKEDACSAARILALGQLRRPELVELLLEHAETGARATALAAIAALRAVAKEQGYYGVQRRRLEAVALGLGSPRPLAVRAAALELVLFSAAERPLSLLGVTRGLREHGPRELRRLCWLRLLQLAETRAELAMLLPSLDPRPRDWFRRAHDGRLLLHGSRY
ncbi:microsomal triglyceride transfer protein large subunit-like isoform X1 [Cydia fagiglandana]|uniref:microsomal triglyceride transfer protein large subunit-like isoform X1 n=1 Tax=Cydia fagiglandana TaxID=1458189 RepID=UPI002FEE3192